MMSAANRRRRSSGSRRRVVALALCLAALPLLSTTARAAEPRGWLYIHRYLTKAQLNHYMGIAAAPFWFFDDKGGLVRSSARDGRQAPGKLVPVPPGTYYVAAGERNVGLTRAQYTVVANRVTVVRTGFVSVTTWKEDELPRVDCSPWDGELTAYKKAATGQHLPVLSNPAVRYKTREFGMLQLPVGDYRIEWHGFGTDVSIREGQVFRLPLGTAGPLGPDRPRGRLSREMGEAVDNPTLKLCDDGPTHVVAGVYWVSFAKILDVYPYEERVWSQYDVVAINDPGYARQVQPDRVGRPLFRGAGSLPVAAVQEIPTPGAPATKPQSAEDFLGGGEAIDWNEAP